MDFREATFDDARTIAALHAESWRATYRGAASDEYLDGPVYEDRIRTWDGRLSSPAENQYVVLAEDGGELIGFACCYGVDDPKWGTMLDNLHVRPDLHGGGVGKRLMARVAKWCLEAYPDCDLYLWVLEQNTRARRFYEGLGAADAEGGSWDPPGGGYAPSRRYTWTREQLREMAEARTNDGS